MGVVFQNFHLIPTMTALENVAVPLEISGDGEAFEKAEAELQAMGLGNVAKQLPGQPVDEVLNTIRAIVAAG